MGFKPPGLPWVGQFFLPLTALGLSPDKALLFSIVAALFVALILLGGAAIDLGLTSRASLLGTLCLVAGTPLLLNEASQYMTEIPQMTVVCWFIFIMARAAHWPRSLLLAQLTLAGLAAALVKSSTPFYVFVPALIAASYLFSSRKKSRDWAFGSKGSVASWTIVAIVSVAALPWFASHMPEVVQHARFSTVGEGAALWGKRDSYLNTLWYWARTTLEVFPFILLWCAGLATWLLLRGWRIKRADWPSSNMWASLIPPACLAQVVVVLFLAGFSSNREARYLLPLLPYFALLTGWSFDRAGSRAARVVFAGLALTFWIATSAASLNAAPAWVTRGWNLRSLSLDQTDRKLLESVVERTSLPAGEAGHAAIIAVDPIFFLDWLAPEPANYTAWKNALQAGLSAPPVTYYYAGDSFLGADSEKTWRHIADLRPRYVLICDPEIYPPDRAKFNRSLMGGNARILLGQLLGSSLFQPPSKLPDASGLLLFESR